MKWNEWYISNIKWGKTKTFLIAAHNKHDADPNLNHHELLVSSESVWLLGLKSLELLLHTKIRVPACFLLICALTSQFSPEAPLINSAYITTAQLLTETGHQALLKLHRSVNRLCVFRTHLYTQGQAHMQWKLETTTN